MVPHTTTGEWQSFEVRMRRRRAERLVLRAQAAADAGRLEDAKLCLAEARALAPALPALAGVEDQVSPPAPAAERKPARRGVLAAAIALIGIAALAGEWILTSRPAPVTEPVATAPAAAPAPPPPSDPPPAPRDVFAAETAAAPVVKAEP